MAISFLIHLHHKERMRIPHHDPRDALARIHPLHTAEDDGMVCDDRPDVHLDRLVDDLGDRTHRVPPTLSTMSLQSKMRIFPSVIFSSRGERRTPTLSLELTGKSKLPPFLRESQRSDPLHHAPDQRQLGTHLQTNNGMRWVRL